MYYAAKVIDGLLQGMDVQIGSQCWTLDSEQHLCCRTYDLDTKQPTKTLLKSWLEIDGIIALIQSMTPEEIACFEANYGFNYVTGRFK